MMCDRKKQESITFLCPTYSGQILNFILKYEYLNVIFEKGMFQGWDYSSACGVLTEDGQPQVPTPTQKKQTVMVPTCHHGTEAVAARRSGVKTTMAT